MSTLSTIWENTDGWEEKYRCASAIYLMSVLSQRHSIIFYRGISASGHDKEVVGGLNYIAKRCIYQLMSTVQLPGSKICYSQIIMHSCTPKNDVSLAKEFQNICLRMAIIIESLIRVKTGKYPVKIHVQKESIMIRIMLMLHTKI